MFISQHVLQPSIITNGLWLIREILKGTFISGKSLWPSESVTTESLDIFFKKIKKWIPWECPCRLCKTYVPQVGFIRVVKVKDTYHLQS